MKIYEVMKELHENKNKVARHTLKDESGYLELKIFENNYKITLFNKDGGIRMLEYTFKDMIDAEKEWEIIQKPVTFEEVLSNDKLCRIEHELLNGLPIQTEFMNFRDIIKFISENFFSSTIKQIFKEGKWYLQE